jgi:hypothetical protein
MRWKMKTAGTTKIKHDISVARHDLEYYCRNLSEWPRSWMGLEKDLPPGGQLVVLFRPFLEHLAASNLSAKTIQTHVDNLWVLGGECIRDLNDNPPLRKKPVEQTLANIIEHGGPLLCHGGEDQQRSFDATCRKLRRFLIAAAP